jgi:hypothetical protein
MMVRCLCTRLTGTPLPSLTRLSEKTPLEYSLGQQKVTAVAKVDDLRKPEHLIESHGSESD